MFSSLFNYSSYMYLPRCFRSRPLHIGCMWERVEYIIKQSADAFSSNLTYIAYNWLSTSICLDDNLLIPSDNPTERHWHNV